MKELHELKRGDRFTIVEPSRFPPSHPAVAKDAVITFDHIDGMYSFCRLADGSIVHPVAWQQVEVISP
jgi:hypothetical protein